MVVNPEVPTIIVEKYINEVFFIEYNVGKFWWWWKDYVREGVMR